MSFRATFLLVALDKADQPIFAENRSERPRLPVLFPWPCFELLEAAPQPCLADSSCCGLCACLRVRAEFTVKVTYVRALELHGELHFCVGLVLPAWSLWPAYPEGRPENRCWSCHFCAGVERVSGSLACVFFLVFFRIPCLISCRAPQFP